MKRIQIAKYGYIGTSGLIVLTGCLFLIWPQTSLLTLCRALGAVILVSGLAKLFGYFANDARQLAFQFDLALGAFAVLLGLFILIFPQRFATSLAVLVSFFVILNAFFTVQNAIEARSFGIGRWWVLLIGAAAAFLVGALVLIRPTASTLFLTALTGVALVIDGIQNIVVACTTIHHKH